MGIVKTSTKSLIHLKASLPIRGASFGTNQPPDAIRQLIRRWLTDQEADNILLRFQKACIPNRQVLWSGMLREQAQQWADAHGFQTLTTALGPLLNPDDLGYPHRRNSPRYIHGASIIFAWFISHGSLVTVLSHPPPIHFHPSGQTFYQLYEEPIIMGRMGNRPVDRIDTSHPAMKIAADFIYQRWPYNNSSLWIKTFGIPNTDSEWRKTKTVKHSIQVNTYQPEVSLKPTPLLTLSRAEAVEPSTKSITNEKNVMMEGGRQKKKKKKKKASSVRNKKADKTTAEKVPKLDSCVNNLSLIKKGRDK
ncbi:hypothetical protein FocTR4_00016846 [Fusarium oxysporum f. sp. cubense]|uniref:Uncharacterized protein n=1 Tax=Fusarium oxysporum f. sp. cubense TaxID=61366 RepID=A0A5C6S963_FUSOC|nr:hypothetical protein FocTR4_00016828 [Fusarium oxysporum f. sp. cubense]TXB97761.1 hypothetical protein FocTR4_00016846 [Fusarium oxysporum f. sp. cubense]